MSAIGPPPTLRISSLPRPLAIPARALSAVAATLALLASSSAIARDRDELDAAARTILGANQGVYVEASNGEVLLAQDAVAARESAAWLDPVLSSLRETGPLINPVGAAALVRAMALRAEVASRLGMGFEKEDW